MLAEHTTAGEAANGRDGDNSTVEKGQKRKKDTETRRDGEGREDGSSARLHSTNIQPLQHTHTQESRKGANRTSKQRGKRRKASTGKKGSARWQRQSLSHNTLQSGTKRRGNQGEPHTHTHARTQTNTSLKFVKNEVGGKEERDGERREVT